MKRILTLTFFALICLCACTKKKITIIEGNVLEFGTDKPIAGAKVEIYQWYSIDILSGGSFFKDTVFTDQAGYFKWESEEDIGREWFEISYITKDTYFPLRWSSNHVYHEQIRFGDHYNQTMHLDPFAYLQLHVEDVPEVDSDFLRISGAGFNTIKTFSSGNNFNETLVVKGNQNIELNYKLSFGELNTVNLSIPAHDTLYHHLKY